MAADMFSLIATIWNHPANRQVRWRAIVRALHWQYHQRLVGSYLDIPYHGFKLRCPPGNHSGSRAIYFSAMPDFAEMQFMRHYLRPGDRFIDAGANLGLYSLLARALVGAEGHVHAFEPNPAVATSLRANLDLNGIENVSLHHIGLSDVNGSAAFDANDDDCLGHVITRDIPDGAGEITVGRLDTLLPDVPYAMAKFDIEGYEPFAIRGAANWLARSNPPAMLVEMGGYTKRHGMTTAEFVAELADLGYQCVRYEPETRRMIPTSRPWEMPGENVILVAGSRLDETRSRLEA